MSVNLPVLRGGAKAGARAGACGAPFLQAALRRLPGYSPGRPKHGACVTQRSNAGAMNTQARIAATLNLKEHNPWTKS